MNVCLLNNVLFPGSEGGGRVTELKRTVSFPPAKQYKQFRATLQEKEKHV